MSDTTYNVNIDYVGQDKTAVAAGDRVAGGLERIQGRLDRVNAGLGMVTGTMERIALGVGASLFGAVTGGALAFGRSLVAINSNLEDTNLAIGAMLQANGATNGWAESMQVSQHAMAQIRADAAALPGEAQDYINIFRSGLAGMLQSGLNTDGAVRMADRVGAVAAMLQVDSQQAGRDLALMLGGRAGGQVRLWTAIAAQVGVTAHAFNALGAEQRRVLLDRALDRYNGAIEASGHTWSALTGTVKTFAQDSIRAFGGPFFDLAKRRLEGLVVYLNTHGADVTRQLEQWGVRGVGAMERMYDRGVRFVSFMRTHWRAMADDALDRGRMLVSVYGGLQAVRAAASGGSALMGALGSGAAGGATAALGVAALAAAAGAGAMALAAHDGAIDVRGSTTELRATAGRLGDQLVRLETQFRPLIDLYGATMFRQLVTVVDVFGRVATVVGFFAEVVGRITNRFRVLMEMGSNPTSMYWVRGDHQQGGINVDRDPREGLDGAPLRHFTSSPTSRPGPANRQRPPSPAGHTTIHNHFMIEQADNPERVALTVQHVLERELRHPTQAAMPGRVNLSGR